MGVTALRITRLYAKLRRSGALDCYVPTHPNPQTANVTHSIDEQERRTSLYGAKSPLERLLRYRVLWRRGLSLRYAIVLSVVFFCVPPLDAAVISCEPTTRPLELDHGIVTLHVIYKPAVIMVGENFAIDVRIDYAPRNQTLSEQFFEITEVRFYRPGITLLRSLKPKKTRETEKRVTINNAVFEVNKEASPGDYEGLIVFQLGEQPPLQEDFCVPVGSERNDFLSIEPKPSILNLRWGQAEEVILDLTNTYPYPYAITDADLVHRTHPLYTLTLPDRKPLAQVRHKDGSFRANVSAKYSWPELLNISNPRLEPEIRLKYEDPYGRRVDVKPVNLRLTIIPPSWLLWPLALLGGLAGGGLRYAVGDHSAAGLKLPRELFVGVLIAFVVYLIFQLGGISLIISSLNLTLDNNTGIVAFFLGLLGGWRGKGVLEKLT
jgi:hypothetical protein